VSFVHLHVHSEYSLLEASASVKDIAKKAAEFQMPAVALTDHGNLFGAIEFYFACLDKNVKPIIGLEAYMAPGSRLQKGGDGGTNHRNDQVPPTKLVLLAQSIEGYQTLCRLSTKGYFEGKYYVPRIDEELLAKENKDILCLSGASRGYVYDAFVRHGAEEALRRVRLLKEIFGDRFYLEFFRLQLPKQSEYENFLIEASKITGVPLIATNETYFLDRDDQIVQDILVCIGSNRTLHDEARPKLATPQNYFKDAAQMNALMADRPEALARTLEVADRCQVKFKLKDSQGKPIYHLPSFPTSEGRSLKEEIKFQSEAGLARRFEEVERLGQAVQEEEKQKYFDRLAFELGVIDRMGFNGYFLIVGDFINWAKEQDIPVGPGRGSGAGSLVAFSLRITDLDPVPYKLLFERFLNPERISMPDFDIDFCQDRRGEVIRYVTEKYGEGSVAQIITYGKLQAKAALKDVGRVLGMTFAEVDVVSKLIPEKPGTTLDQALEEEPRIREMMDADPQVNTLVGLAQRVEGIVRHAGIHAAGVIIADGQLVSHAPLYQGADGESVVQFDMKHAEKIGLIKFDFLGLKTLTLIQHAFRLIEKNRGKKLTVLDVPLADPGIYEIMSQGDTLGIFQFEGEGITDAIRKIKPTNFFDITAINALYRPGPMAMIPEFAKRKHGEEPVVFTFDALKDTLEETYGIIVYQEQVMAIASTIAGYSLGEADMLRRAMGKKIKEEMDQQRVRFLRGAKERGYDEKKAEEVFELMYKFADYGFNKSHAAAYCVVAAHTAWLKKYYPTEFFAAVLSTELSDTEKVVRYIKDAQRHHIEVLPPHVNRSDYFFSVSGNNVYFGLGAIKGVGESAVQAIIEARNALPKHEFESLEHFFEKVDSKKLNKKVIECLIKAGALDGFGYHRAQMLEGYSKFLERAMENREEKEVGQTSLFDLGEATEKKVVLNAVKAWPRSLILAAEKEVLGFYVSDHPLKGYEKATKGWITATIDGLVEVWKVHQAKQSLDTHKQKYDFRNRDGNKKRVVVIGIMAEIREHLTKKGTRMAFGKLEDLTGQCEFIVFPDAYSKNEQMFKGDRPLLITGFLECENDQPKIFVETAGHLETTFQSAKKLSIRLDEVDVLKFDHLMGVFQGHPGKTKLEFIISVPELNKEVILEPTLFAGVEVTPDMIEEMQGFIGGGHFVEAIQ